MLEDITGDDVLLNLATYTSQGDRPIVAWFVLSFLEYGSYVDHPQSFSCVKDAISCANYLSILAGMESGPHALAMFSFKSSLRTPSSVMGGNDLPSGFWMPSSSLGYFHLSFPCRKTLLVCMAHVTKMITKPPHSQN